MASKISLAGLNDYTMKDGGEGPAAILAKDGNYALNIRKAELKEGDGGKRYLALAFSVLDEDAKGAVVYNNIFVDGAVDSGPNKGTPRVKAVLDILTSAGQEQKVQHLIKTGELDLDVTAKEITGATVFARVIQSEGSDGKIRSQPIYYLRQAKYDESKKTGVNFRVEPAVKSAAKKPATPGTPGVSGGIATDQMSSDV